MAPDPQVLAIVASLTVLVFVFLLLRRGVLQEKYAVLWLATSTLLVVLSAFPDLLTWASRVLGVQVPSNLLFFLMGVLLLLISVQLSYEVSRVEAKTRRLAEEIALLNRRLDAQESRSRTGDDGPGGRTP